MLNVSDLDQAVPADDESTHAERSATQVECWFELGECLWHSVEEGWLVPSWPDTDVYQMDPVRLKQPPGGLSFNRASTTASLADVFSPTRPDETRICELSVAAVYYAVMSAEERARLDSALDDQASRRRAAQPKAPTVWQILARPDDKPGMEHHATVDFCRRAKGWPDKNGSPGVAVKLALRVHLAARMVARAERFSRSATPPQLV